MDSYATPIKDMQPQGGKQSKTVSRDGDWICLNCNNLNFSFRKKCNRCKTQTRQQNEATSAYSYYYYAKPYYVDQNQFESLPYEESRPKSHQKYEILPALQFTPAKDENQENILPLAKGHVTPKKKIRQGELPSVSPLLKKYNAREIQTTNQSRAKGLFENESLWNGINVRDFDDGKPRVEEEEDEGGLAELERFIKNIII